VGLYFYGISLRLKDSGFHNLVLGIFSLSQDPSPKRMKSRNFVSQFTFIDYNEAFVCFKN